MNFILEFKVSNYNLNIKILPIKIMMNSKLLDCRTETPSLVTLRFLMYGGNITHKKFFKRIFLFCIFHAELSLSSSYTVKAFLVMM